MHLFEKVVQECLAYGLMQLIQHLLIGRHECPLTTPGLRDAHARQLTIDTLNRVVIDLVVHRRIDDTGELVTWPVIATQNAGADALDDLQVDRLILVEEMIHSQAKTL